VTVKNNNPFLLADNYRASAHNLSDGRLEKTMPGKKLHDGSHCF
jgi:hypothetical protein